MAVFRAAAQGRAGALLHQRADRALLVGHQIQRHHACRYQSRHLLVRRAKRRHLDPRRAGRLRLAEFHCDGPAKTQRPAQDRVADVHADASRRTGGPDPPALGQGAGCAAAQRDLQLRRARLDRTDHADAGDAVRLSVGRAPQADALVRRLDRAAEERRGLLARGTPPRDGRMRRHFHKTLERARQFRAAQRPAVDDGAQRRDPLHGRRQSDGQSDPADRRRQRYHAQHHDRLGAGAERESRSIRKAARTILR